MSDPRHIIEHMNEILTLSLPHADTTPESAPAAVPVPGDAPEPLERLEARICELAGHLTAAMCRFLLLVADFDQRDGWGAWEMPSCAAWLSWKCQIAPGTAVGPLRGVRISHTPTVANPAGSGPPPASSA
jgi:hypothetical protein